MPESCLREDASSFSRWHCFRQGGRLTRVGVNGLEHTFCNINTRLKVSVRRLVRAVDCCVTNLHYRPQSCACFPEINPFAANSSRFFPNVPWSPTESIITCSSNARTPMADIILLPF